MGKLTYFRNSTATKMQTVDVKSRIRMIVKLTEMHVPRHWNTSAILAAILLFMGISRRLVEHGYGRDI